MKWTALCFAPLLFGASTALASPEGTFEVQATVYPSPQVVTGGDLARFLAKTLKAKYESKSSETVKAILHTQSLSQKAILRSCRSRPLPMSPSKGLTGEMLIKALDSAAGCVLADKKAQGAKLTVQTVGLTDGKPVNLGLWAKEKGVKFDFLTAFAIAPATEKSPPQGTKWLVFSLKYPIEHG